jgi:hypothetical protein
VCIFSLYTSPLELATSQVLKNYTWQEATILGRRNLESGLAGSPQASVCTYVRGEWGAERSVDWILIFTLPQPQPLQSSSSFSHKRPPSLDPNNHNRDSIHKYQHLVLESYPGKCFPLSHFCSTYCSFCAIQSHGCPTTASSLETLGRGMAEMAKLVKPSA